MKMLDNLASALSFRGWSRDKAKESITVCTSNLFSLAIGSGCALWCAHSGSIAAMAPVVVVGGIHAFAATVMLLVSDKL